MAIEVTDKRGWLIEQGLAKPTRGRLSREAITRWDEAVASGEIAYVETQDEAPKPKRVAAVRTVAATPPVAAPVAQQYDAKHVRSWAAQRGIEVNERGRIPSGIVSQYLSENGASEKPVIVRKEKTKYREETVMWGRALRKPTDGEWVTQPRVQLSTCGACTNTIPYCAGHGESKMPMQPKWLTHTATACVPMLVEMPEVRE